MHQLPAYRITIDQAYSAWEVGQGYSWHPWGANTDRYHGSDEPVTVEVPDDYRLAESISTELLLYPGGLDANAAIALGIARVVTDAQVLASLSPAPQDPAEAYPTGTVDDLDRWPNTCGDWTPGTGSMVNTPKVCETCDYHGLGSDSVACHKPPA